MNESSFIESYIKASHINHAADTEADARLLIPNIYDYAHIELFGERSPSLYLHLLAGGNIHTGSSMSISIAPLNCFLLLYTTQGSGQLLCSGRSVPAIEKQIILLDCRQQHFLLSSKLPWDFKIFFFAGEPMYLYTPVLFPDSGPGFFLSDFSMIERHISVLLSVSSTPDFTDLLQMHQALTNILGEICIFALPKANASAPNAAPYLVELHDHLEHHFAKAFSLNDFEQRLQISKYRLCREFSAVYGMPPLKYLTKKRMEEAQKMLLTTDWTIHEISSNVGYANVNSFINLFKKHTGTTPGVFRKTHQIYAQKSKN